MEKRNDVKNKRTVATVELKNQPDSVKNILSLGGIGYIGYFCKRGFCIDKFK